MDCAKLTAGLVAAICDKPPVAGTLGRVILINYSDIDRTLSTVTDYLITSLVLKTGKTAYAFESLDDAVLASSTLSKGKYFSQWDQSITLRIFTKSQLAKDFMETLKLAKIVAIVENKDFGGDGKARYEAYGWDTGLELNEGSTTSEYQDNTVYLAVLGTDETSKEATLPKSVFKTDAQQTELMIEGLLTVTP